MHKGRRTKIIATLGPASDPPDVLASMIDVGMDCARLNCSHGTHEELSARASRFREAAANAGRPLALLVDLQGPKIRLSATVAERSLSVGDEVVVASSTHADTAAGELAVELPSLAELVQADSQIIIGDGVPVLTPLEHGSERIKAIVAFGGQLGPRKGVSVSRASTALPILSDKDLADLELAVKLDAEFVALSFVRSAEDVLTLRRHLSRLGSDARVIAKIEKVEAYEAIDEILAVSDGVMVARGDYGVEAGVAQVPLMQKDVISRATEAGRLVITATQMLESMITSARPTRAEATDIANAVIDGTSAVMLSAETGVGAWPVEAVRQMAEIAQVSERGSLIHHANHHPELESFDEGVMHAAVYLARDTAAKALIVPTNTGGTARTCSKYRPSRPVIALTPSQRVANQLALEWGVYPKLAPGYYPNGDELIAGSLVQAKELWGFEHGDKVVITAGPVATNGATNMVMLTSIP